LTSAAVRRRSEDFQIYLDNLPKAQEVTLHGVSSPVEAPPSSASPVGTPPGSPPVSEDLLDSALPSNSNPLTSAMAIPFEKVKEALEEALEAAKEKKHGPSIHELESLLALVDEFIEKRSDAGEHQPTIKHVLARARSLYVGNTAGFSTVKQLEVREKSKSVFGFDSDDAAFIALAAANNRNTPRRQGRGRGFQSQRPQQYTPSRQFFPPAPSAPVYQAPYQWGQPYQHPPSQGVPPSQASFYFPPFPPSRGRGNNW